VLKKADGYLWKHGQWQRTHPVKKLTAYKAISAPVIPEMMYASWNGKKFVVGSQMP
jgi:hypothetical protein